MNVWLHVALCAGLPALSIRRAFNGGRLHSLYAPIERGRDIPSEAAEVPYTTARGGAIFARLLALTYVDAFGGGRLRSLHAPIERGRDIPSEAAEAPYTTARGALFLLGC